MIYAASRAADDERRHAKIVGALARRFEGSTHRAIDPIAHRPPRSLFAIALENAVEGCVHETFSAAIAAWQGASATEPAIANAMRRIAIDEARHGDLAWDVHDWLMPQLSRQERDAVLRTMADAVATLATTTTGWVDDPRLGLPRPPEAHRLVETIRLRLWNAAVAA